MFARIKSFIFGSSPVTLGSSSPFTAGDKAWREAMHRISKANAARARLRNACRDWRNPDPSEN